MSPLKATMHDLERLFSSVVLMGLASACGGRTVSDEAGGKGTSSSDSASGGASSMGSAATGNAAGGAGATTGAFDGFVPPIIAATGGAPFLGPPDFLEPALGGFGGAGAVPGHPNACPTTEEFICEGYYPLQGCSCNGDSEESCGGFLSCFSSSTYETLKPQEPRYGCECVFGPIR